MPAVEGTRLHAPPTTEALAAFSAARLRALGLHARRGATLLRVCRSLDLDRLRSIPTKAAAARIERERGLGPWSVGIVCLEGLGRPERGLARDLGLVKLLSALRGGARVEAEETDELLEPYGEWAGLASVYLLAGFSRGPRAAPGAAGGVGSAVHYEQTGSGFPVLFVHEAIADSRMWEPQWRSFADRYRLLRVDLAGFGQTPIERLPLTHASDVLALLDELGIEETAVVGGSMGGRVSLELAVARPTSSTRSC